VEEKQIGRPRTIDPEAVSLTALRLFDDSGYDDVSMDDIAAATGISRRYLFRLFPNKAALLWGGLDEFIDRLRRSLAADDTETSAVQALRVAYRDAAAFPASVIEVTRHRLRVIHANPGMAGEGAIRVTHLTEEVSAFISTRDRLPPHDFSAVILSNAFAAAASSALTWWALESDERPEDVVVRAIDIITAPL